jgi:hypothetical protein
MSYSEEVGRLGAVHLKMELLMSKTKRMLLLSLGLITLSLVTAMLVAPQQVTLENEQWIHAPKDLVFDQLRYMKNFAAWSPFLAQDPAQKHAVSGPDGQIGAQFHWEGVAVEGKGYQEVVAMRGTDYLQIQCHISTPFEATPTFTYHLTDKDGGTAVRQVFHTQLAIPANVLGMLFGMQEQINATNKMGLGLLKEVLERPRTTAQN